MSKHHTTTPVSIPVVVLTVHTDGSLTVTMNETVVPPPEHSTWRRSSLPEIIDQTTAGRTITVWIEVHETDGTTFTDLIPALTQPLPPATPIETSRHRESAGDTVEGFLPGEDITVARVINQTTADSHGTTHIPATREHPAGSEVVLVGRSSATFVVRRIK